MTTNNAKPNNRPVYWFVGILVSVLVTFMSIGFYSLSAQITCNSNRLKEMSNHMSEIKTNVEVIKVQVDNLNTNLDKLDRRLERVEHNNNLNKGTK